MKQLKTVFQFEFTNYLKRKPFILITIGLMVLMSLFLCWPRISESIGNANNAETPEKETKQILLLDQTEGLAGSAEYYNAAFQNSGKEFIDSALSRAEAEQKVDQGEYSEAILLEGPLQYTRIVKNIGMYDSFDELFGEVMLSHYRSYTLSSFQVPQEDISAFLSATVENEVVTTISGKDQSQNFFYTYLLIFALYFAILMYGQFVSSSVATEKSTRAMEILITSAKPKSLMFGKVFGAGLAGLTQLLLILGAGYLSYNLNASYFIDNSIVQSIFGMPMATLLYILLFFVLGFFIYAFLYAALASLVNRMEELNTATMPVTFMFMIAFFIVMFSMMQGNVDSLLMQICSYFPLTSPMAMFVRISMGEVTSVQIILSIGILILSTIGIGMLAAAIYRMGVLLYGTPPKPKEILRMLKAHRNTEAEKS